MCCICMLSFLSHQYTRVSQNTKYDLIAVCICKIQNTINKLKNRISSPSRRSFQLSIVFGRLKEDCDNAIVESKHLFIISLKCYTFHHVYGPTRADKYTEWSPLFINHFVNVCSIAKSSENAVGSMTQVISEVMIQMT